MCPEIKYVDTLILRSEINRNDLHFRIVFTCMPAKKCGM